MTTTTSAPDQTEAAPSGASPPTPTAATPPPYAPPGYTAPAAVPLPPTPPPSSLAAVLRASHAVPLTIALLSYGACPRCCLRFAGVREALPYEQTAPRAAALLAELKKDAGAAAGPADGGVAAPSEGDHGNPLAGTGPGPAHGEAPAPSGDDACGDACGEATARPAVTPPPPAAFDPPCSVCVGVLQSLDAPTPPLPPPLMDTAAALDSGAGTWRAAASGHPATLAAAFRAEGHACGASALQILYPAAAAVRQVCAVEALRAAGLWDSGGVEGDCGDLEGGAAAALSTTPPATPHLPPRHHYRPRAVVDVKDALRLALVGPLGAALGRRLGGEGEPGVDVSLALQFLHPASAGEADALAAAGAVSAGGKRGKGPRWKGPNSEGASKKRRGGGGPAPAVGRAATAPFLAALATVGPAALAAAGLSSPPTPPSAPAHLTLRVRRAPVLIGGYYTKALRDISQSPFFVGGHRLGRTSVQEAVEAWLLPALRADSLKFVTAGREDMDVRMLGRGRPFVMEVLNARARIDWDGRDGSKAGGGGREGREGAARPPASSHQFRHPGTTHPPSLLADVEASINAAGTGVGAHRLTLVTRAALAAIKAGESTKEKSYRAAVTLPAPASPALLARLNGAVPPGSGGLVLAQTTPTRVEARRAMLVRHRAVHELTAEAGVEGDDGGPGQTPAASHRITLTLRAQAGLYVKEFVHGDGGRTVPDLATLAGCEVGGGRAEITALDVLAVHLDFV